MMRILVLTALIVVGHFAQQVQAKAQPHAILQEIASPAVTITDL